MKRQEGQRLPLPFSGEVGYVTRQREGQRLPLPLVAQIS